MNPLDTLWLVVAVLLIIDISLNLYDRFRRWRDRRKAFR